MVKIGDIRPDIIGLGAVCLDWVSVVPKFPEPDEKVDAISEGYYPGGVTANYITAVTRLGARAAFIGAVGDDDTGDFLIRDMKSEGTITDYCIKKKGYKTATNIIIVNKKDGQKMIIQSPFFTSTRLTPEELKPEWFKAKLLHTTAVHEEVTLKALEYIRKYNTKLSFDLESQIAIRGLKRLEPILVSTDILLPNKLGAKVLTGKKDPIEAAKFFTDMGIDIVVVTLGEKGAVAVTSDGMFKAPAFKIEPVDATGAGDTFCGAFTYAYVLKKWDIDKCLIFANASAALKMLKLGARTGMPTYKEVITFLKERGYQNFD